MAAPFKLSFDSEELMEWLLVRGIDHEDCEKIRCAKFRGASFVRLEPDTHFKELGIPLGTRLYLSTLVDEAKSVAVASANDFIPPPKPVPKSQGSIDGSLSVSNLSKELDSLIQWKKFAIHGDLHVPPSEIDKITRNHPQDIDGQKMALFGYIEKNSSSLGITWATICDALQDFEGNLALAIRKKYCSEGTILRSEVKADAFEDPTQLGLKYLAAIQTATFDARSKWKAFGLELGLDMATLDSIDVRHRGDPSDCFCDVLETWLRRDKPSPAFPVILSALRSPPVGYGALARSIEKMDSDKKRKIGFHL